MNPKTYEHLCNETDDLYDEGSFEVVGGRMEFLEVDQKIEEDLEKQRGAEVAELLQEEENQLDAHCEDTQEWVIPEPISVEELQSFTEEGEVNVNSERVIYYEDEIIVENLQNDEVNHIIEEPPLAESQVEDAEYIRGLDKIDHTMRRLEKKFDSEILNAANRDSTVQAIYKDLNEYKAGLVEKVLRNVFYDIVDLREMMLSKIRLLEEKHNQDFISLEEFKSYAEDLGDILEKHDVLIYKGKVGEENVAVKQKIVHKVETEEEELVKKVAESLSYGYQYNSKVLYPEKISIYVKKK